MDIVKMSVKDLLNAMAPYNPRAITEGDMEALMRSMDVFGLVEPIVYNKRTETVVGGHQRVMAAKALGWEDMDVVIVELDEKREKALNLALNKISGDWDQSKLEAVLSELRGDPDMSLTGFNEAELVALLDKDTYVPEFKPGTAEEQASLDKVQGEVVCPECGHKFKPDVD